MPFIPLLDTSPHIHGHEVLLFPPPPKETLFFQQSLIPRSSDIKINEPSNEFVNGLNISYTNGLVTLGNVIRVFFLQKCALWYIMQVILVW